MKKLYEFVCHRTEEVEEKVEATNDKGETITELKKVQKKIPVQFFLRRPTRLMFEEAELFYGVQYSESIKLGLLTRAQLSSKFSDDVKTFSKAEAETYENNYLALFEKEKKFQEMSIKKEDDRTPEEKEAIKTIIKEMLALRDALQDFEMKQASLFDHTAETRARNRTILWWLCQIAYKHDNTPLLGEGSFAERLKRYDSIEEGDDEFTLSVIKKALYVVSFWYMGRADKQEDFDKLMQIAGMYEGDKVLEIAPVLTT